MGKERSKNSLVLAKQMRNSPTKAENYLWEYLRAKRLNGYKFRRQHVIGRYVVDFISIKNRLII